MDNEETPTPSDSHHGLLPIDLDDLRRQSRNLKLLTIASAAYTGLGVAMVVMCLRSEYLASGMTILTILCVAFSAGICALGVALPRRARAVALSVAITHILLSGSGFLAAVLAGIDRHLQVDYDAQLFSLEGFHFIGVVFAVMALLVWLTIGPLGRRHLFGPGRLRWSELEVAVYPPERR